MTASLLATKLYIPPPRPNLVSRPRLIRRLDEGLRLSHRLTLVSAPAGFGKTTLITEWVCGSAREVAWLSLDEGDNDPIQFFNYLIAALQQIDSSIGRTVLPMLRSPQSPPPQSLVTLLINDVIAAGAPLTLVLDDYQLITSTPVHDVLEFLLERQPPAMHVVVNTRQDPPWPLPRLRARNQVTELRERDLRFTADEVTIFFNQTLKLSLSAQAVRALASRTEGWVAGLQLAALALQQGPDPARAEAFITAFAGDDRYVMDYLIAEVLDQQPQETRDFLRRTAILGQLTGPLCDAVAGGKDSQALLERLEDANLFLFPLDQQREWYRYHRLFAEALRATLDPGEEATLHQRAARWYEAHGFTNQAVRHALAYASASGDGEHAERLISLAAEETFHSGGVSTVRGWLEALPDERVRANGELALHKGWLLALNGELAPAEDYAGAAGTCFRRAGAPPTDLAKPLVLRAHIALMRRDYERTIELAAGALEVLPEDQSRWRVIALWALAESQERTGHISAAIDAFRKAWHTGRALGNQIFSVVVEMSLALSLNNHGQRQQAIAVCEQAVARYTDQGERLSPIAGLIFSRLGMLCYEANQLDLAHKYYEQSLELSRQLPFEQYFSFSYGLLATTLQAQGEGDAALQTLHKARQFVVQSGYMEADWFFATEANIRLKQGDLAFALHWAETAGLSPDDAPQYLLIEPHLVYGRLLLAQGRLPDAQRWLARLERFTQERGLYRWLITVHVQQTLVAERRGERPAALDYLARAIERAAPEDYYRAFLDEDAQVVALLPRLRRVAPAFVDQLLDFAGLAPSPKSVPSQPLVEPLSEREMEVLGLIATGLTNREIAHKLFIAVGTVKRHINNIYGKLEVRRRTEAVARARELDLL